MDDDSCPSSHHNYYSEHQDDDSDADLFVSEGEPDAPTYSGNRVTHSSRAYEDESDHTNKLNSDRDLFGSDVDVYGDDVQWDDSHTDEDEVTEGEQDPQPLQVRRNVHLFFQANGYRDKSTAEAVPPQAKG